MIVREFGTGGGRSRRLRPRTSIYGTYADACNGLFAAAAAGTLFLDEVADLSPAAQARLLRGIDRKEILPATPARSTTRLAG